MSTFKCLRVKIYVVTVSNNNNGKINKYFRIYEINSSENIQKELLQFKFLIQCRITFPWKYFYSPSFTLMQL